MSGGMKFVFDRPGLYNAALKMSPLINAAVSSADLCSVNLWGRGRSLPQFAKESFQSMWKNGKVKENGK
jgi:L-lactate dehydrogenase complex protein LldF